MLFQSSSLTALAAFSFFSHASTSAQGHAEPRDHLQRSPVEFGDDASDGTNVPISSDGSKDISLSDLQLLQSETTAFQKWMDAYLGYETVADASPAKALLRQEIQAYEDWIRAWLDSVGSTGGALPSQLPPSDLVPPPVGSSPVLPSAPSDSATASSSSLASVASPPAMSVPPASQFFQTPVPNIQASSNSTDYNFPSQTTFVTFASQNATEATSRTVTSVPAAVAPVVSDSQSAIADVAPSASAPVPSQPGSSSESSQFDAQSSKNVAVYYDQTEATAKVSLGEMCQDENVDIVVLAFLTVFFGPGGFPAIDFIAACSGQTPQMQSAGADGLRNCPDMASQIKQCQGLGKKVLLSLGGSKGVTEFPNDLKAAEFANQLWDLFGADTGVESGLRPFGDVKIDGFDIDNEVDQTLGYTTFVSSLRKAMTADSSRTYYISAAPSCTRPDPSIPLDAMRTMDFIFVQFYGNVACNAGSPGFVETLKGWSSDLSANGAGPRLYIGAPGCGDCADTGYLDPATMTSTIAKAKNAGIPNFGGIMMWDGPRALENEQDGKDYTAVVKDVLV